MWRQRNQKKICALNENETHALLCVNISWVLYHWATRIYIHDEKRHDIELWNMDCIKWYSHFNNISVSCIEAMIILTVPNSRSNKVSYNNLYQS